MRFIVDAQLPPALARLLTAHGHIAEHVEDIGLREADDSQIWRYALENQTTEPYSNGSSPSSRK